MLKRTVTALSLSVATLVVLAGCAGTSDGNDAGSPSGEGRTLKVLVSAKAAYPEEQKAWFARISDEFEEKTGATVEFSTFATAEDEQKIIQTSAIAGTGPDIFSVGTGMTPTAGSTGAFQLISEEDWDAIGGRDKFVPGSLGLSGPSEDKEVAVPFINRPYVMAYNTTMFEAAGITEPPTSWDEFRDVAKQLTTDDVYGAAIAYGDQYDPWKFIWTMAASEGNRLVDGEKINIDDPIVQNAYSSYFGYLTEDRIVDPASVGWKNAQAVAAFGEGKAAMMMMTTSGSYPTLAESAVKDDFSYAVMPVVPPGETALPSGQDEIAGVLAGDNMMIATYTKNKDLSLEFLELITSDEEQLFYATTFGEFPTTKTASSQVEEATPAFAPAVAALKLSVATPYTGAWGEIQISLGNVVVQSRDDLTKGGVSAATLGERLADAQATSQSALDRAKGK